MNVGAPVWLLNALTLRATCCAGIHSGGSWSPVIQEALREQLAIGE